MGRDKSKKQGCRLDFPVYIVYIFYFNESPVKMMKNAFYFTLEALFVPKICKFLSLPFGHVEKLLD